MVGAEDKHVNAVNLHPGGYVRDLAFFFNVFVCHRPTQAV